MDQALQAHRERHAAQYRERLRLEDQRLREEAAERARQQELEDSIAAVAAQIALETSPSAIVDLLHHAQVLLTPPDNPLPHPLVYAQGMQLFQAIQDHPRLKIQLSTPSVRATCDRIQCILRNILQDDSLEIQFDMDTSQDEALARELEAELLRQDWERHAVTNVAGPSRPRRPPRPRAQAQEEPTEPELPEPIPKKKVVRKKHT